MHDAVELENLVAALAIGARFEITRPGMARRIVARPPTGLGGVIHAARLSMTGTPSTSVTPLARKKHVERRLAGNDRLGAARDQHASGGAESLQERRGPIERCKDIRETEPHIVHSDEPIAEPIAAHIGGIEFGQLRDENQSAEPAALRRLQGSALP